jgi:hypothetical protein
MQLKLEKRFAGGVYILGSYTLSKLLTSGSDNTQRTALTWSGINGVISPFERQRNKSLASDDVPQVFSLSVVYNLPVGQGRRYMNQGGVANAILGGWQVTTVFRKSSGIPYYFRSGYCNIPGQFAMGCVPSINSNPFLQDPQHFDPSKPLFDKAALEPTTDFNYFGGVGPRISNLRGQSYQNQDFGLIKQFRIAEKLRIQVRAEFFNMWNWHIFNVSRNTDWGVSSITTDVNSAQFGYWNGYVTNPRNIQFGFRVEY